MLRGEENTKREASTPFLSSNYYSLLAVQDEDNQLESEVDAVGMGMWRVESESQTNSMQETLNSTTDEEKVSYIRSSGGSQPRKKRKRKKTKSPGENKESPPGAVKDRIREIENATKNRNPNTGERLSYSD